jgi:glycosyltransferase involved in cell wall biosynthesis
MQPLVSIIVPCYNYAKYLPFALESVFAQTERFWECIIVDDGSSDETGRVARGFVLKDSRFKYVYQQNRGLSAARNTGIENSTGKYVQLLDADDLIDSRKLELQSVFLDKHPGVDVVYGDAAFFHTDTPDRKLKGRDSDHNEFQYLKKSGRGAEIIKSFVTDNFIPVSAPLMRKTLFERIGIFDTSYRSYEDWHFWFRAAVAGIGFAYVPEEGTETFIRFGHTSMLSDKRKLVEAGLRIRRFMMPQLPASLRLYNLYRLGKLYTRKLFSLYK